MNKRILKKAFVFLLAVMMTFGMASMTTFAEDTDAATDVAESEGQSLELADTLEAGEQYLITADYNGTTYALSADQSSVSALSRFRAATTVAIDDGVLTSPEDLSGLVWEYTESGTLVNADDTDSYLRSATGALYYGASGTASVFTYSDGTLKADSYAVALGVRADKEFFSCLSYIGQASLRWPVGSYDTGADIALYRLTDGGSGEEKIVSYWDGSGTESDPYQIDDYEDLLAFALSTSAYDGTYFKLMNDIEISNISDDDDDEKWTPKSSFGGTLDGDGHTIEWNGEDASYASSYFSVFGTSSGTIQNLTVKGELYLSISYDYIGGLVAYNSGTVSDVTSELVLNLNGEVSYAGGVVGYNTGTIDTVTVTESAYLSSCNNEKGTDAGGVTGYNVGIVNHATNQAIVDADEVTGVGGIVGENAKGGYILNSQNSGSSKIIEGYAEVGGIVGYNEGVVNSCSNTMDIYSYKSKSSGAGGIAGYNGNTDGDMEGNIWNCWNSGAIYAYNGLGRWAGGIAGFNNKSSDIVNCYNVGDLKAYSYRDHSAGNNEGSVVYCYGLNSITNAQNVDGTTLMGDDAMKATTFMDLLNGKLSNNRWAQDSGSYPTLIGNATTGDEDPAKGEYTITVYSNPYKLTYWVGDTFSLDGLEVRAVYADSSKDPVTITNYTTNLKTGDTLTAEDTTLTISGTYAGESYSLSLSVKIIEPTGKTLSVTSSGTYTTLDAALDAAKDGDTIQVGVTSSLPAGTSYYNNVKIERASDFKGALFNVDAGSGNKVTLAGAAMIIDGGSDIICTVESGDLRLRGGVTLQNSTTAVDVASGGELTVNKVIFNNCETCFELASSASTCTLEDFGGTIIDGTIYLGSGAYITAKAAIPSISVVLAVPTGFPTIVKGSDYALTEGDLSRVSCSQGNVALDDVQNEIYLNVD